MLQINKGKVSSYDVFIFKMTRIEELILQRTAIDAEIEAEYKREQEAAARGEADAQFNLGIIYYKGQGVPQNFAEAFGAFKLASEQGKTQAQYYLGVMYEQGQGTQQDYAEAAHWLELSLSLIHI
jgi:TPR repeat protein